MCIHGTTMKAWNQIKTEGLKTMDRTHIHFATGLNSKSGYRKDSQVLIYINMELAMKDGITFYVSDNGVVLTNGINNVLSPTYFTKVIQNGS
jgi:2'-phosphotransferase